MFSGLESYCITRMPTWLPVLLFEHTVALRLTSLLKHMRLVVVHYLVVSGVVQLLSRMMMHLQSVVSLFALYRASTGADVKLSFSCAKHICCACPHVQSFVLLRRSRIGFVISASCGVNFPNWLIIPRNRRIPLIDGLVQEFDFLNRELTFLRVQCDILFPESSKHFTDAFIVLILRRSEDEYVIHLTSFSGSVPALMKCRRAIA